ncbi:MAG: branched-chain amino acid ABC transporter permease [Paracoccaceae bacterium]
MQTRSWSHWLIALGALALALLAPWVLPHNMTQLVDVMVFILIALGWDMLGGQMGYNSFGNILFFGIGMYLLASAQVWSGGYSLMVYNSAKGGNLESFGLNMPTFVLSLLLGLLAVAAINFVIGLIVGSQLLRMRGHYFAVGTLGLGVAAGEFAGTMDVLGAGSGMNFIQPPEGLELMPLLYYVALAIVAVFFIVLSWLYSTRFGFVMNAIRDNEDKAEAMGLPTAGVKAFAWAIAAFFTAMAGGIYGSAKNFIDPTEVAFSLPTVGVWMLLMTLIGGKGTIWGPVAGAVIFQLFKEFFWTFLFGWQRVALGLLIVVIVVFFPGGIMAGFQRIASRLGIERKPAEAKS